MIELDAAIGALIGVITGATPFIVSAFWRECRERRIERDRRSARQHRERMLELSLNNQRETIKLGIERQYSVDVHKDSIALQAPHTESQPPSDDTSN